MHLLKILAPACFICHIAFAAQLQTQVVALGCSPSHSRHPSPIVIDKLDLNKAYAIEAQTVKSVESSPSTSIASVSSSGPTSARTPHTQSPLDSKRLAADAATIQALPEATASSTSLVQSMAEATLVLTTLATKSEPTTARSESEVATERALDKSEFSTRESLHCHMTFGDPNFDQSVASIPLVPATYTLAGAHVPDAVALPAPAPAPTENQDFEIPEGLQKGMIGYNRARKTLIQRSQSSPDGFTRTLSLKS